MTYDASDPDQIEAAEKRAAARGELISRIMNGKATGKEGREFLFGLIYDTCHTHRLSLVPDDAYTTAFNEGGRSIGLNLIEELQAKCPDLYLTMLKENLEERN